LEVRCSAGKTAPKSPAKGAKAIAFEIEKDRGKFQKTPDQLAMEQTFTAPWTLRTTAVQSNTVRIHDLQVRDHGLVSISPRGPDGERISSGEGQPGFVGGRLFVLPSH
jgi:hypothetical protein